MSAKSMHLSTSIEPLESRIAPALLVAGANLLGGAGNPTTGEGSVGDTSVTIVKVLTGSAIVWYNGLNIEGISFGPNTTLEITGSVSGDIVGNLTAQGRLSDSDHNVANGEDGNVLLPNNLLGLKVNPLGADPGSVGDVNLSDLSGIGYSIITGGSVSNVDVNFALGGIYAGDGVFHALSKYNTGGTVDVNVTGGFDKNPIQPGIQTDFTFTTALQANPLNAPLQSSGSIKGVTVGKAFAMQVISGSGGPANLTGAGAPGGSISSFTIETAQAPSDSVANTLAYQFITGDGANGVKGGAGGSLIKIIEKSSTGLVDLRGGNGGVGSAGAGGAGGSFLSLDLQSSITSYTGVAGTGGAGTPGGAGGSVVNANFANNVSSSGLIFTADFTGDSLLDVAVVDGSTGRIVIAKQVSDGVFELLTQYVDNTDPGNPVDVKIVASPGQLPSDGAVVDIDGDNDPDLLVAYKGTNSVALFLNQGNGSFYDVSDADNPKLRIAVAGVFGSPNAIDIDPNNPGRIVVAGAGEVKGKEVGTLELIVPEVTTTGFNLTKVGKETTFPVAVSDVAIARSGTGFGGVMASLKNGVLFLADYAQQSEETTPAFTPGVEFGRIVGGVRQLDISSDGATLAALSTSSGVITLFDLTGTAPVMSSILEAPGGGKPVQLHFVDDEVDDTPDTLFVLSNGSGAARITFYVPDDQTPTGYSIERTFDSAVVFRNFAPFGTPSTPGFAAITSAINFFSFSSDFSTVSEQTLPFSAGKTVDLTAGAGGAGVDFLAGNGKEKIGNGGVGGSISSINVEATVIKLTSGNGGGTAKGAGGAAGSITNPASFIPAGSTAVAVLPRLYAEDSITLTAGNGGAPTVAALTAAGGDGGSLRGLSIELLKGDVAPSLNLAGGTGANSLGGRAGAGGSIVGVTTITRDSSLNVFGGQGGEAMGATGAGGAGGSVSGLKHTLTLDEQVETNFKAYAVTIVAGNAGTAVGGVGGAGGSLSSISLDLDNSNIDEDDLTNPNAGVVNITLSSGDGGNGTAGGAGGSLSGLLYNSHHDQISRGGFVILGYFTMDIDLGDGGDGSTLAGGAGGTFKGGAPISGLTAFNPNLPSTPTLPLEITAGDGGDGATIGGLGGSISGLEVRNALFFNGSNISGTHLDGVNLMAGSGGNASAGNGGAGGSITGGLVGAGSVLENGTSALFAIAGAGGNGGAVANAPTSKGGAGGSITGGSFSFVGVSGGFNYALVAGPGGDGAAAGGVGGSLTNLKVNIQQHTFASSVSILQSGDGGDAAGVGGKAGKGGDIKSIGHLKDLNSVITAIYAGHGGDAAQGTGGVGGTVAKITALGVIGQAADNSPGGTDYYGVFNPDFTAMGFPQGIPQGIFAGRGGASSSGFALAGSVTDVSARQIAAIGVLSATPGLFQLAEKVNNIKADVIGYDIGTIGTYEAALDGFIRAKTIGKVTGLHPFDITV